jgi:hypothetical protein
MSFESKIPGRTIAAYRSTNYDVNAASGFILNVDQPSPNLVRLHQKHQVTCSAYITAYNPFSNTLTQSENESRHQKLISIVKAKKLAYYEGEGQGLDRSWPSEKSLLILGLDLATAKQIGNDFEQNAIIWTDTNGSPQLILLR